MSYKVVIDAAKQIESLLEKLGASGRGLHEKVTSIEDDLPNHLVKKVRFIATRRNQFVHQSDVKLTPSSLIDFQTAYDEAEKELLVLVKEAKSYFGILEIENDEFSLSITRFIIRDKEILLSIDGADSESCKFYIEGLAVKTDKNIFIASKLSVRYQQHKIKSNDKVSIAIQPYKITKKGKCKFSGVWLQDGNNWGFKAKLKPIILKK